MNNPYNAPGADMSAHGNGDETYQPKVMSMSGRIGRVRYIAYSTCLSMALALVMGILMAILIPAIGGKSSAIGLLVVLFYVPLIALAFIMAIRRVHDMGHSGWMSLICLVPLVNFWLLFAPGTEGANEYGPAPVKNSTGVIIAAFSPILFAFVIGILAAISIPAYQAYVNKAKAAQVQSAAPAETEAAPQ